MNLRLIIGIPLVSIAILFAIAEPKYWYVIFFAIPVFMKKLWIKSLSEEKDTVFDTMYEKKLEESLRNKETISLVNRNSRKEN